VYKKLSVELYFRQRDNENTTGTGEGGGKYNKMNLPILDILGQENPSVVGWTAMTIFKDSCRSATGTVTYICTASRYTLTIFCQR
jgi:hypothetical protein